MSKFSRFYKLQILKRIYKFITFFVIRYYSFTKKIVFRKNTSDTDVFRQVFVENEYILPIKINPKFIIDGGANVGYASLWFAENFPKAKIIAIEPEKSNYNILKQNIKLYKNIESIQAGLWHKSTYLRIVNTELGKWGSKTVEVDSFNKHDIQAITINNILNNSNFNKIDILKLDIEGSEKEVFSKNLEWLDKTNMIIIELHDKLTRGCSESLYSNINKGIWNKFNRGENVILVRKKLL